MGMEWHTGNLEPLLAFVSEVSGSRSYEAFVASNILVCLKEPPAALPVHPLWNLSNGGLG